jgi:hypothetical protein
MALIAESKGFNSPDEDTTDLVSLTSSVWGSEAPKTHFVFGMGNSANSEFVSIKNSIGWSDGTDNVAIGVGSRNNVSTNSVCNRAHQTSYNVYPLANNGAIYERAVQSSYNASTPSIGHTWSNSANDGYNYFLWALGGDDVENVSIDTITSPGSTGDVSYTGPGFQPDFLIVMHSVATALPLASTHVVAGIGMSDGTTDAYVNAGSQDNVATSNTSSRLSAKFIHYYNIISLDEYETAVVKSLDSSGYTLTWELVSGTNRKYTIIAVKGPSAKVITTAQPTTNTTNDLDAGFVPKAGLCIGAMKTASASPSAHNRFMIGTWDEQDNMDCGGWMDEDGQTTTDVDRFLSNTHSIKNYNHAQSVVGQATVAAYNEGIRETWTSTDGTQYAHSWLLLGDKVTDFPEISVTGLSDNVITDGDSTPTTTDGTDFGSIDQGASAVTRTFKVANSGAATLTTETPTVPTGFTLTEGLSTSIATSGNDTFSVRLDNSVVGVKHGSISFVNNDTTLNPFNFTVSGVVTAASSDTPAASTGITSIISSGLSQLNTGNSLVSVGGARGLGASGTLITEITNTNRLDRTINEPGAPIEVLDSRFADRMDETSYYAGSGAYWGSAR